MYAYFTLSCSDCRRGFSVRVFSLNCGLGPPLYICAGCGRLIKSHRVEWLNMSIWAKTRMVIVSLIESAGLGLFSGGAAMMALHFIAATNQTLAGRIFGPSMLVGLIAGLSLQIWRVARSLRRSRMGINAIKPDSSLECNLQGLCLSALFGICLLALIIDVILQLLQRF